jgi:flagellar biogenesis protein FliO
MNIDPATLLRLLAAFGVIALLLYGLAGILRYESSHRLFAGTRRKLVTPIENTMLSNTASLHVVRIVDQYYVLGSSGEGISIVRQLDKTAVEAHLKILRANRVRTPVRFLHAIFRQFGSLGGGRTKVR